MWSRISEPTVAAVKQKEKRLKLRLGLRIWVLQHAPAGIECGDHEVMADHRLRLARFSSNGYLNLFECLHNGRIEVAIQEVISYQVEQIVPRQDHFEVHRWQDHVGKFFFSVHPPFVCQEFEIR